MQRRANAAYDTQCVIASIAGTVPEKVAGTFDPVKLREEVGGAEELTASLHQYLHMHNLDVMALPKTSNKREKMTVYLLDIEGTTTALPFVRKVMVPIVIQNLESYTLEHYPHDADMVSCVKSAASFSPELKKAFVEDEKQEFANPAANGEVRRLFNETLLTAMEEDKKLPYVKYVQGNIWAEACARHELETHVFPDVASFIRAAGRPDQDRTRVAIYSSGSALSQKMVMGNSPYGDLNPFIFANLDPSTVGGKLSSSSYEKARMNLASLLNMSRDDFRIIFISDNPSEASAAEASGAVNCSIMCIRPLNAWVYHDSFLAMGLPYMCSFSQLLHDEPINLEEMVGDLKARLGTYAGPSL